MKTFTLTLQDPAKNKKVKKKKGKNPKKKWGDFSPSKQKKRRCQQKKHLKQKKP